MEKNKLHQALTYEEYSAEPGVRASTLRNMMRSPAHCKHFMDNQKKPTPALHYGKIFHSAIENGERFLSLLKVEPKFTGRTKDGKLTDSANCIEVKEKRAHWWDDLPLGATVVTEEEHAKLIAMVNQITQNKMLCAMIKDSIREASLWAEDNETGLTIQCRPDLITSKGHIIDFKTALYPDEKLFMNTVYSAKYPGDPFYILQAAHYTHCMRMAGIGDPEKFVFVACGSEPPYPIAVYPVGIGGLGAGDQWRSEMMRRFKKCQDQNHWPFNDGRAKQLDPPEWMQVPGETE